MFAEASHSPVVEAQRGIPDLPPESHLAMPRQALFGEDAPNQVHHVRTEPDGMFVRRALILTATLVMTISALVILEPAMPETKDWLLPASFLVVFTTLFGWISFAFLTCIAGVCRIAYDREDERLGLTDASPLPQLHSRTALLAPVYNEDPDEVARRLRAIDSVLSAHGVARNFHIFVLSDSNDPDVLQPEYEAFVNLRAHAADGERRVFYRRRTKNAERKSGNVADWVRTFGGEYDHMVTLDADSLMSAETLIRLAAAMERHGDVGLIQTTPRLVGRSSLFGRIEQFAHRLYGPLLAHGMAWWSGAEANYYGHNAIIRTKAFADHCGLPVLPGSRPFGGAVLSHDFVEAALIRRGGWGVLHAPSLSGSYEECPPTLSDFLDRDRRWCQGNVQHLGLLGAKGLHWVSRLHMLIGASSYFTAPLWLAFMVLGLMLRSISPEELEPTHPGGPLGMVYLICMCLLFLPKLFAFAFAMRNPETRRGFGGPAATLAGIGVQSVFSALTAPILMWSQTRALFDILTGRDSGWNSQRRAERGVDIREAAKRYRSHTALGIFLAFAALAATPHTLAGTNFSTVAWMAPVLIGLIMAAPIGSFSARADIGEGLRRVGVLSTPEETLPVRVLILTNHPPRVIADNTSDAVGVTLRPALSSAELPLAQYSAAE
ncbi:MAG: glucans biosynthesis glucosyltransferase MdoH [Caulobacterales bacterium]